MGLVSNKIQLGSLTDGSWLLCWLLEVFININTVLNIALLSHYEITLNYFWSTISA